VSGRARQDAPGQGAKRRGRPKCPICGKPQQQDFRPFCSKRCADLDLSRWLEGRYAVPGEPASKHEDDEER
jgi:endogenous inhibitor of DNA gyrase (YacG/DUF329 family)